MSYFIKQYIIYLNHQIALYEYRKIKAVQNYFDITIPDDAVRDELVYRDWDVDAVVTELALLWEYEDYSDCWGIHYP